MGKKKTGYKQKIEKEFTHQRVITRRIVVICVFLFLFSLTAIYYFYTDPVVLRENMEGVVIGIQQSQGSSAKSYFAVMLKDGRVVHLNSVNMGVYKKGRKVLVHKKTSKKFKRTLYSFVRYLD